MDQPQGGPACDFWWVTGVSVKRDAATCAKTQRWRPILTPRTHRVPLHPEVELLVSGAHQHPGAPVRVVGETRLELQEPVELESRRQTQVLKQGTIHEVRYFYTAMCAHTHTHTYTHTHTHTHDLLTHTHEIHAHSNLHTHTQTRVHTHTLPH